MAPPRSPVPLDGAQPEARFTIGQLARRSGFSTSALRYYERSGLLTPVARTDAGYRLYDEASHQRLRFVARAKRLGCTLSEIVDLVTLLDQDACRPVQARLHTVVTDKLAAAEARRAELDELVVQLRRAASQLTGDPVDGPCTDRCACHDGPQRPEGSPVPIALGRSEVPAITCSLDPAEVEARVRDWWDLQGFVIDRQAIDGRPGDRSAGLRLLLDPAVPADRLLGLTMAEQGCCTFFAFAVTVDGRGLALEVRAPHAASDLVETVFGPIPNPNPTTAAAAS